MATKKAKAETIEVAPQQTVVKPTTKQQVKKPTWEIKDRTYVLIGEKSPITLKIPSKHTTKHSLLYFDRDNNRQREVRYATNQSSAFVDEQKGEATLGHILFKNGSLFVPKEKQSLQKVLSMYHPLKNRVYKELDQIEIAEDELDILEMQIEALNAAKNMDIDHAEAILRVEIGSKVTTMSSKELRRDLLLFAKMNPALFIDLANDENVQLRNFAIQATENNIIKLSSDQRYFTWATNGRKLMEVPFDENPYSAMAAFFKTDEGVEVYRSVEKNLE